LLLEYKKGCTLLSVAFYILVFFLLYPVLGAITPMFSVLPVLVVGWGYGLRGGFVAGLLSHASFAYFLENLVMANGRTDRESPFCTAEVP